MEDCEDNLQIYKKKDLKEVEIAPLGIRCLFYIFSSKHLNN